MDEKLFFLNSVYSDRHEFESSLTVESYDRKTVQNFQNSYVAEKRIVSKLLKILIINFDNTN